MICEGCFWGLMCMGVVCEVEVGVVGDVKYVGVL